MKKYIFILIGLSLGLIIGYTLGYGAAVEKCLDVGFRLADQAGIDLTQFSGQAEDIIRANFHRLGL